VEAKRRQEGCRHSEKKQPIHFHLPDYGLIAAGKRLCGGGTVFLLSSGVHFKAWGLYYALGLRKILFSGDPNDPDQNVLSADQDGNSGRCLCRSLPAARVTVTRLVFASVTVGADHA
jgi:hypothetical protein